jgi:hypothetical protein
MEILAVFLIFCFIYIFLKLFAFIFNAGVFLITLPFIIMASVLSVIFVVIIMVPLGIVGALAGMLMIPFAFLGPVLPIVLIFLGAIFLLRRMAQ